MGMNYDSGEIIKLDKVEDLPQGWALWQKGEVVNVKNCWFKVWGINLQQQELVLKAISNAEAIKDLSLSDRKIKDLTAPKSL